MADLIKSLVEQTRAKEDEYDSYRFLNEDMKHWYCRKEFIRHNHDRYFSQPDLTEEQLQERRDELDCLSRVWANMHFLGTHYSIAVMKKIQDYSYGMAPIETLLRDGEEMSKREGQKLWNN